MTDHTANKISWQAYGYMWVCLENMRDGAYPNGQKFKAKDYEETQKHIDNCTDILNHFGCALPVIEKKQLELF